MTVAELQIGQRALVYSFGVVERIEGETATTAGHFIAVRVVASGCPAFLPDAVLCTPEGAEDAEREQLRRAIEYAPASGPVAPDLRGVWTAGGWYVCAPCVGRIIARGCGHLVRGEQVWQDPRPPLQVCVTCGG